MFRIGNWIWNPFDFRNDTIDSAIRKWSEESIIWVSDDLDIKSVLKQNPGIAYKCINYVLQGLNTYEIYSITSDSLINEQIKEALKELGGTITEENSVDEIFEVTYLLRY